MSNKKLGWVPVYRGLQDHWVWSNEKPFSDGQAWVDLMLSVNHEKRKIVVNGQVVVIMPGQMWTSYVKLGGAWNWSRARVYRYIKKLKSDGMITVDATPSGTLITLLNWAFYNGVRNTNDTTNDTTDETAPDTTGDTTPDTQTIMINNSNNEEEVKKRPSASKDGATWQ